MAAGYGLAAAGQHGAVLELDGLTRRYGTLLALDDVSFSVAPGEVVGFVGRNGAGKTSAMRIALGLLAADRGTVRWQGAEPTLAVRRRRFGYLPEERGLYPKMKVGEQLRYLGQLSGMGAPPPGGPPRSGSGAWASPTAPTTRLESLSLGNQQRAQLAAAVVHDPEVLVLDEPFSGLDPVGVDTMAQSLRDQVDRGAAVLFSSHQLELVERLCDRVVIIDQGRVVADGTIAALRSHCAGRARRRVEIVVEAGPSGHAWVDSVARRGRRRAPRRPSHRRAR